MQRVAERPRQNHYQVRVVVVECDRELGARVQHQLAHLDDVVLEVVRSVAPPLVLANGEVIVLDLSALAPSGYQIVRVLQSRGAEPPLLILRAIRTAALDGVARSSTHGRLIAAVEARLHAAVGRSSHKSWLPVEYTGAYLDARLPGTSVTVQGQRVPLAPREAELLAILLTHVNCVVAREVLIAEIWGFETRSLDVHIRRLRRKLGQAGGQIETVPAFGYRFTEQGNPSRDTRPIAARLHATPFVTPP